MEEAAEEPLAVMEVVESVGVRTSLESVGDVAAVGTSVDGLVPSAEFCPSLLSTSRSSSMSIILLLQTETYENPSPYSGISSSSALIQSLRNLLGKSSLRNWAFEERP